MELSCSRHGSSVHVLAYGADPASPRLAAEMARVREGRLGRLAGVLRKLAELGVPVSEAEVMAEVGNSPSVGRPHIADALIKANKEFDLLLIPNAGHGFGAAGNYVMRRRWDYFVTHLLGAAPPTEYQMKRPTP